MRDRITFLFTVKWKYIMVVIWLSIIIILYQCQNRDPIYVLEMKSMKSGKIYIMTFKSTTLIKMKEIKYDKLQSR